ncbi:MAG: hypothetical protein PF495_03835 [Spirochaetales bacterium]|nr:hypothetical protein [Spirochaetales bacterium]
MKDRILNFLIRADMWLNYHAGGNRGETISSRWGRRVVRDQCLLCKIFCRTILLPLGLKHCVKHIQAKYVE